MILARAYQHLLTRYRRWQIHGLRRSGGSWHTDASHRYDVEDGRSVRSEGSEGSCALLHEGDCRGHTTTAARRVEPVNGSPLVPLPMR